MKRACRWSRKALLLGVKTAEQRTGLPVRGRGTSNSLAAWLATVRGALLSDVFQ